MMVKTEQILFEQLKSEDNSAFRLLYKFYFPSVASFIKQNSGSKEDAEDVFQEAILVLLEKIRKPEFELTASLKTYLYAISRNIWLKRLRDIKQLVHGSLEDLELEEETFDLEFSKEEKIISWIEKVTFNCQRILRAIFYLNEPMESLMQKMGWKNKHTASNQQYKCIQQVKKQKERDKN